MRFWHNERILIVEDEPGLRQSLADCLNPRQYYVDSRRDGKAGLETAAKSQFDLIILDIIMLPSMSGLEVCHALRQRGIRTPVLMLTARASLEDKVLGLREGADDYMTKPFEMEELLARVAAHLRRASATTHFVYEVRGIQIDFRNLRIVRGGQMVDLSEREARLLRYFLEHEGPRRRFDAKYTWRLYRSRSTRSIRQTAYAGLRRLEYFLPMMAWIQFAACATVILFAGARLSHYADIIAEKTGLGSTWIGVVLLASVTSLPELITGTSSVALVDAPDIAAGDVLGSCMFNILIIALLDLIGGPSPLSARAHQGQVLTAGMGIFLLGLVTISLHLGPQMPSLGWVGLHSVALLFLYLGAMRMVFAYEQRRVSEFVEMEQMARSRGGAFIRCTL